MKAKIVAICIALMTIVVVSTIFLPVAQAQPAFFDKRLGRWQKIQWLKYRIEQGFWKYLQRFRRWIRYFDNRIASALFRRFLKEQPQYQKYMKEYHNLLHPKTEKRMSIQNLKAVRFGGVLKTFEAMINGSKYKVELRRVWLSDGSGAIKVSFYGNGRIRDPWILVKVIYLRTTILWWTITYGEKWELYEYFVTNNNGKNEALLIKAKFDEMGIEGTFLGAIIGVLIAAIPETGGLSGILAGILVAVNTYQMAWMKHIIDTAYDSRYGLAICTVSTYLYFGLGGISLWAWWWADYAWHRALPAPGLEMFSLSIGYSQIIANSFRQIGDKYGYDRWVWIS